MLALDAYGREGGPSIVLLHGWPLDRSIWSDVAPGLAAAGFRVLAPDLPGFGGSGGLDSGRWTVEGFADEVEDFLDERTSGRVALAGHSFGGYVALALAERTSERLAGLGLISSRTIPDTEAGRAGRKVTIEKVRAAGASALLPDLAVKLLAPNSTQALRERAASLVARAPPHAIIAGLAAMAARPDRTGVFGSFRGAGLVLHGSADQLIPVTEAAQSAASEASRSRVILDGIGHMPMWEDVPRTTDAIAAWARAAYTGSTAPIR